MLAELLDLGVIPLGGGGVSTELILTVQVHQVLAPVQESASRVQVVV